MGQLHKIIKLVSNTTVQLHSTKLKLKFCAFSSPTHGVSVLCDGRAVSNLARDMSMVWDGQNLQQRSPLEISSTILQKTTFP